MVKIISGIISGMSCISLFNSFLLVRIPFITKTKHYKIMDVTELVGSFVLFNLHLYVK